jgi:hypothetical protein
VRGLIEALEGMRANFGTLQPANQMAAS